MVPSTISRPLAEVGLRSQRPLRHLTLTRGIFWSGIAANHHGYHRILFDDENLALLLKQMTIFSMSEGAIAFVLQRHTATTPGVMVWDATSYESRSSLVILQTSLTTKQYVDTILRSVVLSFMARHLEASFQQDNTRSIPLAYLWSALVPLILFPGQKGHQTFHQSNMSGAS
ncbi:transposable element Tcb2 transposase [Trichonephila clavipes]|uniref:Transposable element Tcb2 transposase n=1 Tax=Trichonephila clavipes TaxID=2585209 RepID=A0A8X6VVV7_TRICX|nr:transposable element Tcb2 transposase [Trichonephila clavipes]